MGIVTALLAATSTANAGVTRTPAKCTDRAAPKLCAIHFHHHRVNTLRHKMQKSPLRYRWIAEQYPARRARILTYWVRTQARTEKRLSVWRQRVVSSGTCAGAIRSIFPASAQSAAFAIARRESGLSNRAYNPSGASGCFQLMPFWWNGSNSYGWRFDPFNARQNVYHAFLMWRKDGGSFCPGQWCL